MTTLRRLLGATLGFGVVAGAMVAGPVAVKADGVALPLCAPGVAIAGSCQVEVAVNNGAAEMGSQTGPYPNTYGADRLRAAYGPPGGGQTVAIVVAYGDPNLDADLEVYRSHYGLGSCRASTGCLKRYNQLGQAVGNPTTDPTGNWEMEESLDAEMVSAICPSCSISVVEANDNTNLYAAMDVATGLANVVSNSWGSDEFAAETQYDSHMNHAGKVYVFSSGDNGYGRPNYPAASAMPNVIAAGGTVLGTAGNARGYTETAWNGAGSGCSAYESKPYWQVAPGCGGRMVADVSAAADTVAVNGNHGIAIYDTIPATVNNVSSKPYWTAVGGTSVSTPIVAAMAALNGGAVRSQGAPALYRAQNEFWDATGGSNGSCNPAYFCTGGTGYDGPTGLGSPSGAFPSAGVAAGYTPGSFLASSGGGVVAKESASFFNQPQGLPLSAPVVGIASTTTHGGYWLAASDGGIFAEGDARFAGSMGGQPLSAPVVGIAASTDNLGYWEVARDGGIFNFGTAGFYGSMGGHPLNAPVVGMAGTPSNHGYWLVASDGGIFAFGDAVFHGSMGGQPLSKPIVGMEASASGGGYWLVASDGGIFAFGDAPFKGSLGGVAISAPIVGMKRTPTGQGYWMLGQDGKVYAFGDALNTGSGAGFGAAGNFVGISW